MLRRRRKSIPSLRLPISKGYSRNCGEEAKAKQDITTKGFDVLGRLRLDWGHLIETHEMFLRLSLTKLLLTMPLLRNV